MKPIQFLMIVRGWYRSGLSSIVSLVSLSIGLLCSITLLLFAVKEFRLAESLGTDKNVYIIESEDSFNKGLYSKNINKSIPLMLADTYPEVEDWAVIHNMCGTWNGKDDAWEPPFVIGVSANIHKLINIKLAEGSIDSLLAAPNRVAISRQYAAELFPGKNPIGQTLEGVTGQNAWINNVSQEKHYSMVVTGILDDTSDSFIKMRALTLSQDPITKSNPGQMGSYFGFIRLSKGTTPEKLLAKIAADTANNSGYNDIRLIPLTESYFATQHDANSLFESRNKSTLIIGVTIALAVLIIAAFNYINITLTRAPRRLKNLAGQRIMGASKANIRAQIFADTALNVGIALGVVLFLMQPSMELFNSFMGSSLSWSDLYALNNLTYILSLILILITLPSLNLMAKFGIRQPMEVFKNPCGNKLHSTKTLVIAQMVISVVLIAFSINVTRQMDYVVDSIPSSSQLLMLENQDPEYYLNQEFADRLKSSASTISLCNGGIELNMSSTDSDNFHYLATDVSPNYFNVLGIKILQGRTFDSVETPSIDQVVVNETFVREKDLENPIGYEYKTYPEARYTTRIVGVCEDFTTNTAAAEIQPTIYSLANSRRGIYNLIVRFAGSAESKTQEIKELHKKFVPNSTIPLKINTVEDFYKTKNPEITHLQVIINFFAMVSVFLTAFGLFGLSWYTVERRRKEIALRKIHGSTTPQITTLLCRSFFLWTAISAAIALPLGYYITERWLEGFVYKINNSLWTLALTLLAAATVTFITVIFQTWRAASANPANTIKME